MATATRPDDRTTGRPAAGRLRLPLAALLTLGLLGLVGCNLPSGFNDYVVFDGLTRPTSVEFSSDGRVFVTEKSGVLKVFDGVDDTTATVVADLRTNTYNSWDRGMLGLALHPDVPVGSRRLRGLHPRRRCPAARRRAGGRPDVDNDVVPDPAGRDGRRLRGRRAHLAPAAHRLVVGRRRARPRRGLVPAVPQPLHRHRGLRRRRRPLRRRRATAPATPSSTTASAGTRAATRRGRAARCARWTCAPTGDPLGLSGTDHPHRPPHRRGARHQPARRRRPTRTPAAIVAIGLRNPFRFTVQAGHERPVDRRRRLEHVGGDQPHPWAPTARSTTSGGRAWTGAAATRPSTSSTFPCARHLYQAGDTVAPDVHLSAWPGARRREVHDSTTGRRSRASTSRPRTRRIPSSTARPCSSPTPPGAASGSMRADADGRPRPSARSRGSTRAQVRRSSSSSARVASSGTSTCSAARSTGSGTRPPTRRRRPRSSRPPRPVTRP